MLLLALALAPQSLALELVAAGLDQPTHLTAPPGDPRLFVAENRGRVRVIEGGTVRAAPFLDLTAEVHPNEGLAALAFHPDYPAQPFVYVSYQDTQQRGRLVRYTLSSDPYRVDPASALDVLAPYPKPSELHNFGEVTFGPDGMLYLATGDGNLPNELAPDHARDLGSLLGKVLRLDVDAPAPHIPPDNPFSGTAGARGEVVCFGLRNPWRMSFDGLLGDLWIGDVGRAAREEVNATPYQALFGADFGWRCREGSQCTVYAPCAAGCNPPGARAPLVEYPHSDGRCAVIGGHVYRGGSIAWLQGRYVYGDFCTGRVATLLRAGDAALEHTWHTPRTPDWQRPVLLSSFGVDGFGELYLLDVAVGRAFRLVDGCGDGTSPCASNPNSTGSVAEVSARGSLTVADNQFTLFVHPLPSGSIGYFIAARTELFVPNFSGSAGNLCIGPMIQRFSASPRSTDVNGEVQLRLPLVNTAGFPVAAGDVWTFQYWFRDVGSGVTSNTSSALRVTFCP